MTKNPIAAAIIIGIGTMPAVLATSAAGRSEKKPGGTIEGVAYLSVQGPHRIPARTAPQRGIKVTITAANGRSTTTTTARGGRFVIGVIPGTYEVTARLGEPVSNVEHLCGKMQRVTVTNRKVRRLRVLCHAR